MLVHGPADRLRSLVERGRTLLVPDAHDVLVARLAAAEGFEALYVGSLGIANAVYGIPDQSLLGINQLIDQARLIADSVDLPICLDMEDGGGNAVTTYRNVVLAEAAGVAAIQIEDHVHGKAYGPGGELTALPEAADKISAAVDARRNPETIIIGRTEAMHIGLTEDEAFERAAAYAAAGADLITVTRLPLSSAPAFAQNLGVPLANFVLGESADEVRRAGLGLAIHPGHALVTQHEATRRWLRQLRAEGVSHTNEELMSSLSALNDLVGGPVNSRLAERYGLV